MDPTLLANFKFASDGSGGTIVYDPPVPTTSSQNAPTPSVANIALLGSYMASSFALPSANQGGTMIVGEGAQPNVQSVLTNPHHA